MNTRGTDVHKNFEAINGSPRYLGTIQSTGANVISNLSGAFGAGDRLLVQPDATGYILPSEKSASPATVNSATTGVKLAGDEKMYITLADATTPGLSVDNAGLPVGEPYLQWISATGTTNLKVWSLR